MEISLHIDLTLPIVLFEYIIINKAYAKHMRFAHVLPKKWNFFFNCMELFFCDCVRKIVQLSNLHNLNSMKKVLIITVQLYYPF